jgi:hypothetical protein
LIVPRGFVKAAEYLGVLSRSIVVDEQGDELRLHGLHYKWVRHDLVTKLPTACAPGYLLEERKHGATCLLAGSQCGIQVSAPGDGSCFDGL